MTALTKSEKFTLRPVQRGIALVCILLGGIALALLFKNDSQRAWVNLLIDNLYFLYFAIAGALFIAINNVTKAGWATAIRRAPEAMTTYLPVAAGLLFVLFYFGMHALYGWTNPDVVARDPVLSLKTGYLNTTFFAIRFVIYFILWMGIARMMRRNSLLQDQSGDVTLTHRNLVMGVLFIPVFAFSISFASYDWVMSMEPDWYSTMFGVYNFATLFLHGLAAITLLVLFLRRNGYLKDVLRVDHLHDLGKLIFGFSVFWAYIWFGQFMLIWYANIPEEVEYFARRWQGNWQILFYVNLLNWLVPFFGLMMRKWKRNPRILAAVCFFLMASFWLDLYLMVGPDSYEEGQTPFGVLEVLCFLGFAGLFALVVSKALSKMPLVPSRDPYLDESLHLSQ